MPGLQNLAHSDCPAAGNDGGHGRQYHHGERSLDAGSFAVGHGGEKIREDLSLCQVERIAERGSLSARQVKIPGILVDCVVVARPENQWQTYVTNYSPAFSCEFKIPTATVEPLPMDERKLIARRAAFELRPNMVVNLGIGMPEGIANVANEEGIFDYLTLTAEAGSIGGIPAAGLDFGASTNMDCPH